MPRNDRQDSQFTLFAHTAILAVRGHSSSKDARSHCGVCCHSSEISILSESAEGTRNHQEALQTKRNFELNICERELTAASESFRMKRRIASAITEMSVDAERQHQDLLELISSRSSSFDNTSSVASQMDRNSLDSRSDSLSLLPASPPIFHGRESELANIAASARRPCRWPYCTIFPSKKKYAFMHFISCESANTRDDLLNNNNNNNNIGLHLGLEPSRQLSKSISSHLHQSGPCLVVLDNFETPWETIESRSRVEEFLSSLSAVPSFALLITMRGGHKGQGR
ncbi:hypothetical protein K438DRAFT_634293 [Mycena galopus ATCC 62051]|nr:hypothetical protein K438DRAFT_634293 [Mycena galopus ATCC 62051]